MPWCCWPDDRSLLLFWRGELGWRLRAGQIAMHPERSTAVLAAFRLFGIIMLSAMIAVGVYGADALRSMRFATARLLVATLGIIALTLRRFPARRAEPLAIDPGLRDGGIAIVLLVINRLVVGGFLVHRVSPPRAGAGRGLTRQAAAQAVRAPRKRLRHRRLRRDD
jgi:hypothetical protein